ncbi:MAG: putative peptide zinc metalloprotease protein [Thermomicrobiales bacterium]|nr:putative peptide zinc metalloprotease protein [Thermomicrobiales bacterium]
MSDRGMQASWRGRLVLVLVVALLCTVWVGGVSDGGFVNSAVRAEDDNNQEEIGYDEHEGREGAGNIVHNKNHKDGRLRVRGRVQLNRITGQTVAPVNSAYAYSSCTECQTLAVAMQINLIGRDAKQVAPKNEAVAVNWECNRCVTVAVALQYVYSVDDPHEVPRDVDRLIKQMNRELKSVAKDKDATLSEAIKRINGVITQFQELATSLDDDRDAATAATSPDATPEAPPAASPQASPDGEAAEPAGTTAPQTEPEATTTAGTTSSVEATATVEATSEDAVPKATDVVEPTATATDTPAPEPTAPPEDEGTPPA